MPPKPAGPCTTYFIRNSDIATIGPGLYCSITVDSSAQLTLDPGIYYIEGGNFEGLSNGIAVANEVMLYLDSGDIFLDSNFHITITAPTSGPYAGLAIYMDRDTGGDIHFDSNISIDSTGTIYGANTALIIDSNSLLISFNSQIAVNEMRLFSNTVIDVSYDESLNYDGGPGGPTIDLAE